MSWSKAFHFRRREVWERKQMTTVSTLVLHGIQVINFEESSKCTAGIVDVSESQYLVTLLLVISNSILSHIKLVPTISHQPANITFLSQQICTSHSKLIRSRCCYTSQKLIVIYLNLHVMTGLDYEPVMQLKIYLNLL